MKKNIKLISLIMNVIAVVVTSIILIGSTFAWFTDSISSTGNKIQAGTLKVDLLLLDKEGNWDSLKDDNSPIFDYDRWEPGYTDVKVLKIENAGSLALQWKAKFSAQEELSELADVIDVYVKPSDTELSYPTDRNLDGYSKVGTVREFVDGIESTTKGTLTAGQSSYLGIALKMQNVGNEFQGKTIGGTFDIIITATQVSSESDGFNDEYDSGATLDFSPVYTPNQLRLALANREEKIVLMNDIVVDETFNVYEDAKIEGNGFSITRINPVSTFSRTLRATPVFDGNVIVVADGTTLVLEDITIDGGAVWSGEVDQVLGRGVVNESEITATGALITAGKNSSIVLGKGVVLQNNDGANAVNLGMRIGATLVIDGGEILNINSSSGAIWGGGHITLNSGKINSNSSTGIAGAIRMVSSCNFTMTGGEIKNNKATTTGGAIYGYGASTYNFEGGEISGNFATVGGAIYSGDSSVFNIKNDFKIVNNTANKGGAMRLENRTVLNMEGGEISGNISTEDPTWNGFYGWNVALNYKAGLIKDSITLDSGLIPQIGGDGITGVIYFALNTNHNTCNLASDFGTIKFHVAEGANFGAFNLKMSADYTYTEGDETKLVCLNDGYVTYYDQATNSFRLKAVDAE